MFIVRSMYQGPGNTGHMTYKALGVLPDDLRTCKCFWSVIRRNR